MAQTEVVAQFEIQNPPTDGITRVKFTKDGAHLLVSSWDKTVTLYNIDFENFSSKKVHSYDHKAGVLDCTLSQNSGTAYSGGCDNLVIRCDLSSGSVSPLLSTSGHSQPIRCVQYDNENQYVITGSWDKTLKVWDDRVSEHVVLTHHLPSKVFAMSTSKQRLIVEFYFLFLLKKKKKERREIAKPCLSFFFFPPSPSSLYSRCMLLFSCNINNCVSTTEQLSVTVAKMFHEGVKQTKKQWCSGREIYIYDLRKMKEPEQKRESSLKHQTRSICGHTNGEQFILASIEGRVAIEYFDPSQEAQQKKFAFKCHRSVDKTTMVQTIYPVNCVSVHPIYGTFATGGCDGIVSVWDMDNKKRISQFSAFATSIASIDFSGSGNQLMAIAQSYTWEQGPTEHPKDSIFIRRVKEAEMKPKQKKK
ncbi:hypothetical protein RFI_18194 [Reticulomyxa filosa]|uniref:Mitotic checkpoint protein BUB3 n=1 Tax=Reticulomyxa filosa TaxID=46433 RepID=X6MZG4_RETFI|nr:hypothetical protein RFI_18194 [Reticulomyxa filosa]|eukprot:ETO19043.1 hypothetical protein RFI_18194 [Reticulomyxa filosa]